MATIEEMKRNAKKFEGMTLAEIRSGVQSCRVDTNLATATAAQIEQAFLRDESRAVRIAVFLAGLMANLVEGE